MTWRPDAFARIRAEKGLRIEDLLEGLRVQGYDYTRQAVSWWEREESTGPPHRAIVRAVAEVLGCPVGELQGKRRARK